MALDESLLSCLVCPKCKGALALAPDESGLDCSQCKLRYPIEDEIPILLTDDAKPID